MAQQTKRRRSKYRGNAAGMRESQVSGGTNGSTKKGGARGTTATTRANRFDQPPSWRGALNRALIAIVFFVLLVILIFKQPVGNVIALSGVMLLIYVPMGYYTDLWLYNRRQRQKAEGKLDAQGRPIKKPKSEKDQAAK